MIFSSSFHGADSSIDSFVGSSQDETLRLVFGKAFLVELDRGNLDLAKVFACAFLDRVGSAWPGSSYARLRDESRLSITETESATTASTARVASSTANLRDFAKRS